MHLKALEINGFKSFALPTHLEFTRGLTAIVGPNGSGKSNVADAVRWVLGETSLKMLRGKKSEDVIFAGSHARSRHSMAEVTMTFDNADEGLPIDAAEVALTRRLFRNGESEYEINGTQVLLRDLQELLLKSGFSQRSYAVVGQGQVDSILRATPAERKEVFEEAAGVKQYQVRKEQSLRKLETTRRNLVRVEDLVGEIKPRLASLRRQAERASEREQIERELHAESLKWFGAELAHLESAAHGEITQLKSVTKEREALEKKVAELDAARSTKEQSALDDEQAQTVERLTRARSAFTDFEQRRNELRRRRAALQQQELPTNIADLPERIATQQATLDRLTRRARELVPQVEKLRVQVAAAEKQREETSAKIVTLRATLAPARPIKLDEREISALVAELETSLEQLVTSIEKITSLAELSSIKRDARSTRSQLSVLAAKVRRGQTGGQAGHVGEMSDPAMLNSELDRVLEVRDTALAELATAKAQLAARETEHSLLADQVAELKRSTQGLEHQIAGAKRGGAAGAKQAELKQLESELKDADRALATQEEQLRALEREVTDVEERRRAFRKRGTETEEQLAELREQLAAIVERSGKLQVAEGQHHVRRDDLLREASQQLGAQHAKTLARGGAPSLPDEQRTKLKTTVEQLRRKLAQAGGIDETVLDEFKETDERFSFLTKQGADLDKASATLREVIEELDGKIHTLFSKQLELINGEFDKAFKVLFNGGSAKLLPVRTPRARPGVAATAAEAATAAALADESAVETEEDAVTREVERLRAGDGIIGVDIKAIPPGKKLQSVSMLSGGEKALTSIALLSAILATRPSPFVILDEVDAALDEANSRRFAKIVKSLSVKTQFITITHNRETMRQASILYGVTMQQDGVSKLLSVKLEELAGGTVAAATAGAAAS